MAQTELITENVQEGQHDNEEQYDGKNTAVAAWLVYGRMFAFDVVVDH